MLHVLIVHNKYGDMTMNRILLAWLIMGLSGLFSTAVNATVLPVTIGNLTYDGTTITGDGYRYLGLDTTTTIGTTYADFVNATSVGGAYAGFSIAGVTMADQFTDSLLGGPNACSSAGTSDGTTCGTATGWSTGLFGLNYTGTSGDWFQFDAGATGIRSTGQVQQYENAGWTECHLCDEGIGYLVYQVPEPSVIALLIAGLFGLGFSRRRRPS